MIYINETWHLYRKPVSEPIMLIDIEAALLADRSRFHFGYFNFIREKAQEIRWTPKIVAAVVNGDAGRLLSRSEQLVDLAAIVLKKSFAEVAADMCKLAANEGRKIHPSLRDNPPIKEIESYKGLLASRVKHPLRLKRDLLRLGEQAFTDGLVAQRNAAKAQRKRNREANPS